MVITVSISRRTKKMLQPHYHSPLLDENGTPYQILTPVGAEGSLKDNTIVYSRICKGCRALYVARAGMDKLNNAIEIEKKRKQITEFETKEREHLMQAQRLRDSANGMIEEAAKYSAAATKLRSMIGEEQNCGYATAQAEPSAKYSR
jgi:hypothetical protein